MKILILGLPRSGTSSLYDFLRKSLPITIASLGSFIKMFRYLDAKSNGLTESLLGGYKKNN
jgi:hypothetical protein